MRIISLNECQTLMLHKQHLIQPRSTVDAFQTVQDVGGLHATSHLTPYLSLFSRLPDFRAGDLEDELYSRMRLVKIRWVRNTLYVLPVEFVPVAIRTTQNALIKLNLKYLEYLNVSPVEVKAVSRAILELLPGREMTAAGIRSALETAQEVPAVLSLLCDQGLLVRWKGEKGWKDHNPTYRLFSEALPDLSLETYEETEAVPQIVEWYLRAYGPVAEADIVWWTGLGKTRVRAALAILGDQIASIRTDDSAGDFFLLPADLERLGQIHPAQEPVINLLPTLDSYLMGYRERGRYLEPRYSDYLFDRSGNAAASILIAGKVAGIWDFDTDSPPRVKLFLFEQPGEAVLKRLYRESERIGSFLADCDVKVVFCERMVPLKQRPAGSVLKPLKGF